MAMLTVAQALACARQAAVERLDAHLLLAHVLQKPRTWLLANDSTALTADQADAYLAALARRGDGEPLAYIVGQKEFHGLRLVVNPGVLVPRPDTETLVDWGVDLLRTTLCGVRVPQVVDLGTGSGAIALAVKAAWPAAHVIAVDASAAALNVARSNAQHLGHAITCIHSDWWSALAGCRFDLALANPPYIADDDAHLAALRHEPRNALACGPDGLDAIRRIVQGAADHLAPHGWLLFEHGHDQADPVRRLLAAAGFEEIQSRTDLAGIVRCSGGRMR
jgi:release factor glutamine methyltransferase